MYKKGTLDKIPAELIKVSKLPNDFTVFDIQFLEEFLSKASYLFKINCSLGQLRGSIILPSKDSKSLMPALTLFPS